MLAASIRSRSTVCSAIVFLCLFGTCARLDHGPFTIRVLPEDAQIVVYAETGIVHSGIGNATVDTPFPIVVYASRDGWVGSETIFARPPAGNGSEIRLRPMPVAVDRTGGLLHVSESNPRYFATDTREALYLTGAHTWNNVIDMGDSVPVRPFDFDGFLAFLDANGHNLTRLWSWELANADSERYPRRRFASPLPWQRTGPGLDAVGLPRFDLNSVNPAYLDRLEARVRSAEAAGIYVIVMLFEGWGAQFAPGGGSHPFLPANNINGVDVVHPEATHSMARDQSVAVQRIHARAVVTRLNDYDNVMYEIVNEASPASTDWQYDMIRYVRSVEARLEKSHLVGMTAQYPDGDNAVLFASDADWVSPRADPGAYKSDPRASDGRKAIVLDTDHLWGSRGGDRAWVWKAFCRGLNTLYMDRYVPPDGLTDQLDPKAGEIRSAMGLTRSIADRFDLSQAVPRRTFSSSGYALVGDRFAIVYHDEPGEVEIDLRNMEGLWRVEWQHPASGQKAPGDLIGAGIHRLRAPFPEDAVLILTLRQN